MHGFRSSFRDWAAERPDFSAEVAEMALAHVVSDKVEAAYCRGAYAVRIRPTVNASDKRKAQCQPGLSKR